MIYKAAIKNSMEMIAKIPNSIFIGYNLKYGSKMYGTMDDIPQDKILEMPISEALMAGMATGMALSGFLPVLIFERMNFMLLAMDQIINHLDKIKELSDGQFNPKVIIRVIVGFHKPFTPGPQHLGDYSDFFRDHVSFPIFSCRSSEGVDRSYRRAIDTDESFMVIEHKELYGRP